VVTIVHGTVQRGDSRLCERSQRIRGNERAGRGKSKDSQISSASLAGTATNNSETDTHLGAVTRGAQPHQVQGARGVCGMREKSRERGSIPRWGGSMVLQSGVVTGVSAHSAEGGHKRRTALKSFGFTPILSNLSTSSPFPDIAALYSFFPSSEPDMVVLLHFRLLCVVG
jgi:hypothetical protein